MYKIDYQISGNTPNFNIELIKGDVVTNTNTMSESGVTATFSNLDYDVLDYQIKVTDNDGNVDTYLFDTLRKLTIGTFNSDVWVTEFLPSGKIVIGGKFTTYTFSGITNNSERLIILNSDGSVYRSFPSGFTNGYDPNGPEPSHNKPIIGDDDTVSYTMIRSAYVDIINNGIIIGGNFTKFNDVTYNGILKLDYEGNVNTTFSLIDGGISGIAPSGAFLGVSFIETIDNDNILIGGVFEAYRGIATSSIAKISKTTGVGDNSFTPTFVPSTSYRCAHCVGNVVYVGGEFTGMINGTTSVRNITAFNLLDGSPCTDFIGTGSIFGVVRTEDNNDSGPAVYVIKSLNNKLYVGGNFDTIYGSDFSTIESYKRIAKFNINGSVDTTFANGGIVYTFLYYIVRVIYIDENEMIYLGGSFTNYRGTNNLMCLIKIDKDGYLDPTYLGNKTCLYSSDTKSCKTISPIGKNKLLIGGGFDGYTDPVDSVVHPSQNIVIINNDGTFPS